MGKKIANSAYEMTPTTMVLKSLEKSKSINVSHSRKKRKINQYTLEGKFIATFESGNKCAEILGLDQSAISRVCNPNISNYKTVGGFIFKYK